MRRKDREVTAPQEIADIMSRCEVVRLAINTDTIPYILPVNFGMEPDGMTLYIHGAMAGTKYDLLAQDNRVSFEMDCSAQLELNADDHACSMAYESVIGWGLVEELTEQTDKRRALKRLMGQYHAEEFPFNEVHLPKTRILKIDVQSRTAKRRRRMV